MWFGFDTAGKGRARDLVYANVCYTTMVYEAIIKFPRTIKRNCYRRKNSGKRALLYVFRFR